MKADVIAFVAGVIATGSYFSLSSMLLIRTSSHTCGRWYLPMFLLRDGLLIKQIIDKNKTLAVTLVFHLLYGYYIGQNVVIPSATVVLTSTTKNM